MRILHTEASPGWGGQELRILKEAEGMRARGHQIIFAVQEGGGLVLPARKSGFLVYEIPFKKSKALSVLLQLMRLIRKARIEIVNTHSSLDAWIGGVAGKLSGCRVIRTRHLSTPIRKGINSRFLYNWLADYVVTTCEEVVGMIQSQASLPKNRVSSIPTGIDPLTLTIDPERVAAFRKELGVEPNEILVGTLCVLRGWKGVSDFLMAAKKLEHIPNLHWVIVGGGVSEKYFRDQWVELGLEQKVHFTGFLEAPFTALAAMDIFLLLSWANEGVSQAVLQAGWLEKPLVTTPTGGLKEVCFDGKTGFIVPCQSPDKVAAAVQRLVENPMLRQEMGSEAKKLIESHFTLEKTLNEMEKVYNTGDFANS